MSDANLTEQKRRLRREMLGRLSASDVSRLPAGRALAERISRSPVWRQAERLVLFASRTDEIPLEVLLATAVADVRPLLLPRMVGDSDLEFAVVDDLANLRAGRFEVLEPPADASSSELAAGDLVLVPGLAFDRKGGRLGRGVGYYDRALARTARSDRRPLLIGVGFSFQLIEQVPMDDHDVRMDGVANESTFIVFREQALVAGRELEPKERSGRE